MVSAMIAVMIGVGLAFFLIAFPLIAAWPSNAREARLKEMKKYSIRPLDLR